jgi:hypothetical protein
MVREKNDVRRGNWYWEEKIEEMKEGYEKSIGWEKEYENMKDNIGYDKFGYYWRYRKGKRLNECRGKN